MPQIFNDQKYMEEVLDLARRGIALASPNPCVGAVIVDVAGHVIGRGFYTYDGLKHAEVLALEEAGEQACGATVYLNLEPCSHTGRTGPCADALIKAGVKRVVAGMIDPNPLVAGAGFEKLRAAGIEVHGGLLTSESRKLNEAFGKYIRHKTPLVTLKTAMTLDGKIAPPPLETVLPGEPVLAAASGGWITSESARAHVHTMRHASDAIMVGVGTIIADDPLLTDRSGLPRRRPLLRVILDSRLRLPMDSRVVKTAHDDLVVFCCFAEEHKRQQLESRGVGVVQVPIYQALEDGTIPFPSSAPPDGRPDLQRVLEKLGETEITSLIIEGGAMVNWAALSAGIVDKVFFFYAPKILAGSGSIPFALGAGYQRLSDAAYVKNVTLHRFGEDFAVEGQLKDPYE